MSSSWTWRSVSTLAVAATLLLAGGFVYGVKEIAYPSAGDGIELSTKSSQPAGTSYASGQLRLVSIGDSLAKGTGDDEGKGFGERVVERILAEDKSRDVKLIGNLGINGLLTAGLADELTETGVKHMLQGANVILLSIGGNDLFQDADDWAGGSELPTEDQLNKAIDSASSRLAGVIKQLETINPKAKLVYIGLYNPFSDLIEMRGMGNKAVSRWNSSVMDALSAYDNTLVIPTYDLFGGNLVKYLSDDHFHPNGEGYEQIAARIVQSLD